MFATMLRLAIRMDRRGQYDLADRFERLAGEYWVTDSGDVLGADGDVGDYNHEAHVLEQILYNHELDPEQADWGMMPAERLAELGLDAEEIACLKGKMDARDYAIRHWGWGRILDDVGQVRELTPNALRGLANAWYEHYGDDPIDRTFDIEVGMSGDSKLYSGVPWDAISGEDPAALLPYRPI